MGREAQETARFAARAGELRDALISVGRLRGVFDPMLETLPSLGTLAVLVVGAYRLRQGAIEVSELVSVAFLFTVLAFPVRAIGWVLAELPRSVAGWDRIRRVLDATGEMPYGDIRPDPAVTTPATLTFADVGFAYEPAEAHLPGAEVLGEVSFTVPAGKTVALVGPTGSGKSTVTALAVRLVDPHSGTVSIDGVDVRDLAADVLAGTAALVAQVPFVFDDTVRANVSLDRPGVDDGAVWAALRLAEADGFVAALPDGLDTMVGERGTSLSGGQRQRLTLARALAGRPACWCSTTRQALSTPGGGRHPGRAALVGRRRSGRVDPGGGLPAGDHRPRRRGHLPGARAGGGAGHAHHAAGHRAGLRRSGHRLRAGRGGPRPAAHVRRGHPDDLRTGGGPVSARSELASPAVANGRRIR
ncbi:hypothetical protein GCM10029963_68170 [Micromonospora andamanensis]